MASGKAALQSDPAQSKRAPVNLLVVDLALRFTLLAMAVTSLGIMITSNQIEVISSPLLSSPMRLEAKFSDSSAIIYFVVAISLTSLYSILTMIVSGFAASKPTPAKLLFLLAFMDTLMAGVVASATGAVASIAYIGLKGNSHVGWNKVCNVFDKFCRHAGIAVAISLTATMILILLVVISTYSLYRRSH